MTYDDLATNTFGSKAQILDTGGRTNNFKAYELGVQSAESEAERRDVRQLFYQRESEMDNKDLAETGLACVAGAVFTGLMLLLKK